MDILLLIVMDIALGAIAWRLGKKNEKSNSHMEAAVAEMGRAVNEMKVMNSNMLIRMEVVEFRVTKLEVGPVSG